MGRIKNYFINMKIRKKMMLSYLLACVVPLVISCFVIYQSAVDNLQKSSLEFAKVFNSQIVSNIEIFCEEYSSITKLVLLDNDILMRLNQQEDISITERVNQNLEFQKLMQRFLILKPDIYNVMFITEDNRVFQANNLGINIDAQELVSQEWIKKIDMNPQFTVTRTHPCSYYDRLSDTIAFTVVRSIFDYRGKYIGKILLDINPYVLINLSDEFYLARNQYNIKINVTDQDGGILYDSDVVSGNLTWQEAGDAGDITLYEKNPKDYIVLTTPIKQAPLLVNIVIPRADLLLRADHVTTLAAVAVLCSILVVIIISMMLSETITRPLRKLRENISKVKQGEYQVITERESTDEIGDLIQNYNQMVTTIKELIQVVYAEQIKQKEAEYLALKTQINPHVLYNTLESIRMKALLRGEDEIAEMIKILAKMFRTVLRNDKSSMKIKDELSYVESYMKLQSMRYPEAFAFCISVDDKIRESYCMSMMLQPIVENSIEHGMRHENEVLHIEIKGSMDEQDRIILKICDDGKGMSEEIKNEINGYCRTDEKNIQDEDGKRQSIGLRNISKRISLYYGFEYSLQVSECSSKGTIIEICIPGKWEGE